MRARSRCAPHPLSIHADIFFFPSFFRVEPVLFWLSPAEHACFLKKSAVLRVGVFALFSTQDKTLTDTQTALKTSCVQNVRDCLYCEKDVGGGLCHGHISHLVHPKTLIFRQTRTRKKMTRKSRKHLVRGASDVQFVLCWLMPTIFFGR